MALSTGDKIGGITFAVFFSEAMLHYNIGLRQKDKDTPLKFPPIKQLVEIAGVVLLFSVVNAVIINKIVKK